jgi:hypothetical protein
VGKVKKVILAAIILFSIVLGNSVHAQSSFEITDFQATIRVREDNTYEIFEKVNVRFFGPSERYQRMIPLTMYRQKISLRSFEGLSTAYEMKKTSNSVAILLGESDIAVAGDRSYSYQYTLFAGEDSDPSKDFFFLNVLPDESYGRILQAKIEIIFPKEFDITSLSVNVGEPEDQVFIPVEIRNKQITIRVTDEELEGKKLNVSLVLPEGYFSVSVPKNNVFTSLTWIANATILFLIVFSLVVCFIFRNKRIKRYSDDPLPLMAEPPIEAAYIQDGQTKERDIVANIIYWANAGHVGFLVPENIKKPGSVHIVKKENLDHTAKPYEKEIFNLIFSDNEGLSLSELSDILKAKKNEIGDWVHRYYRHPENMLFSRKVSLLKEMIRCSSSVPFIYFTFKTFYIYTGRSGLSLLLSLISSLLFLMLPQTISIIVQQAKTGRKGLPSPVFWLYASVSLCLTSFFFLLVYYSDILNPGEYFAMVLSGILIFLFSVLTIGRTARGNEKLEHLIAFKNHLLNVFNNIIRPDSDIVTRFFEYLPYAMVTSDWEKCCSRLFNRKVPTPFWLDLGNVDEGYIPIEEVKKMIAYIIEELSRS